jgi:hypothetical protein
MLRVFLLLLFLEGAAATPVAAQEIHHPRREYVVTPIAPTNRIRIGDATSQKAGVQDAARRLARDIADARVAIGTLDGDAETVFGNVVDVAIDDRGNVLTLDNRLVGLREYDQKGRFRSEFGRAGRGPGELVEPVAMATGMGDRLFIVDAARRLIIYQRTQDSYRSIATVTLDFTPEDVCTLGDHVVIHGVSRQRPDVIFLYNVSGQLERSFAEVYKSPNAAINTVIGPGKIACDPTRDLILFATGTSIGQVRAYTAAGELKWITSIDGLVPLEVSEIEGRRSSKHLRVPDGGYHQMTGATFLPPHHFLVQTTLYVWDKKASRIMSELRSSLLIAAADGSGAFVGNNVPLVVTTRAGLLGSVTNDPFPRVSLYGIH